MGRFTIIRGYGVEEGPSNNDRPLPKKPRTFNFISDSDGRAAARNPNSTSDAPQSSVQAHNSVWTDDESEELSEDESDAVSSEEAEEGEEEVQQLNRRSGGDVQSTEARVNSIATENGVARGGTPKSFHVTLTDPDVLDCAICLEPLSSPIYQCENGHIACASCCTKMRNKCPNCSIPIGYNRCRAIEKVLESIKISCPNKHLGCNESLSYCKKLDHEKTCTYTPCSCPYPDCDYVGPSKPLYLHFNLEHSTSNTMFSYGYTFDISLDKNQRYIFLQEINAGTLFIINRSIESFGSCVSVTCIAPSTLKKGSSYEVKVKDGESSIEHKSVVENTKEWIAGVTAKKFLFVPNGFMGSNGQLNLVVVIYGDSEYFYGLLKRKDIFI